MVHMHRESPHNVSHVQPEKFAHRQLEDKLSVDAMVFNLRIHYVLNKWAPAGLDCIHINKLSDSRYVATPHVFFDFFFFHYPYTEIWWA